jgi:hypothetical protein
MLSALLLAKYVTQSCIAAVQRAIAAAGDPGSVPSGQSEAHSVGSLMLYTCASL